MAELIDPGRYERVDRPLFETEFADFLPDEIYDIHVHLHVPEHGVPTPEAIRESWAAEAPHELSRDQLQPLQEQLFPGRRTRSLVFANPSKWVDIEAANAHVAAAIAADQAEGLLVTRPEWTAEQVRELLMGEGSDRGDAAGQWRGPRPPRRGVHPATGPVAGGRRLLSGFIGLKPYPGLAGGRFDERVAIDDFFPAAHQALADELGLIVMLHLPRPERLRDRRNQAEVRRMVEEHPHMRLIIAHIGRAYTMSFAEDGLQALCDLPAWWDFAMNLNAEVIARALEVIGPERVLYGSDLPIALMRGMRRHEGDAYINYSDGDYTWNTPERRMPPEIEAQYTLYLYEELRAFKQAVRLVGLTRAEVERVMNGNARALVSDARSR